MNNNDLVILAKAIGKKAYLTSPYTNSGGVAAGDGNDKPFWFLPKENNDQFIEVFEWLGTIGYFNTLWHRGASYYLAEHKNFDSDREFYKDSIIDIAIQVAKYLYEVEENDS